MLTAKSQNKKMPNSTGQKRENQMQKLNSRKSNDKKTNRHM